jgi:sodium pump decarboxylase gamma subunit
MNEQFSYSLLASGLGILIVFTILVLLSVVMILIRKFSGETNTPKGGPEKNSEPAEPEPQLAVKDNTEWIIAAVAAFLAAEDDEQIIPQALSWTPSAAEKYDPWVNTNKLSKSVPGA